MASGRWRQRWRGLDPPARPKDHRLARTVARAVGRELASRGARAVVLGGSWARGDAHRESDIDLWVFGRDPGAEVLWRDPFMVTIRKTSEAGERRRLRTPPEVGGSVPGWRVAVPIWDPEGIAGRLRSEARRFRWERISGTCDRWTAEQTVGWAEEAVKLVRALATGNDATAAVQRDLLADHLGFVVAIHRRMFWDSENEFWERVGHEVGGAWARAQRRALGIPRASLEQSCRAALSLYVLTARSVWEALSPEQRAVVANTCRVAGMPLAPGRAAPWPDRQGRGRDLGRGRRGHSAGGHGAGTSGLLGGSAAGGLPQEAGPDRPLVGSTLAPADAGAPQAIRRGPMPRPAPCAPT